ncbi:unnamed protein product [Polarella glacialis]|uniref:Uncharacterized protein n=1 Tax=Polarella glacialis TaxID=89957 RepID=A0A813HCV0_POLGL|nr:unnamed protein product [Polarella glacialis]CAE8641182.1 unnamed protein product [Polarella glacialis]
MQGSATPEWLHHQEFHEKLLLQGRQEQPWSSTVAEGLSCAIDSDDADDAGCETPMGALWTKSVGWMRHSSFNFRSAVADDSPGRDGATRSAGGSLLRDPEPEGRGSGGGSILNEHFGWNDVSPSEADGLWDTESEHLHGTATPEWQEPASPRNLPSAGSLSHKEIHEKLILQGRQGQSPSAAAAEGLSCADDADDAGWETPRERALWTKRAGCMRQSGFNLRAGAADERPGRDGAARSAGGSHLRNPEPEGRGSGSGMAQVFGRLAELSASEAVGLWDTGADDCPDTESEQCSFDNISVVSAGWCVRQDVGPCDGVRSSDSDFDNFSD